MSENFQDLTKKEQYELKQQGKKRESEISQRKRSLRRVSLWVLAVLLLGGAVFGAIKLGVSSPSNQTALLVNAVSPSDWVQGNKESKVVLVEYSDFQCPACGAFSAVVKQLNAEYGSKMQFVYRHFPLPQHGNAKLAAYAAEAAGKQNKFWEMHDLLFEHQQDWSESNNAENIFLGYAKSLGLNIEQYQNDFNSKEVADKVNKDYQNGDQAGISATPTFFLNGKKLELTSYEELGNIIKQTIASAGQ